MSDEIFEVLCPTCQKSVPWTQESQFRPFCSKRCQLIDLGEWAAEEKAIPSDTADFAMDPNLSMEYQMSLQHHDNGEQGEFFLLDEQEKKIAKLTYFYETPDTINANHTFVDDSL